MLSIDEIVFWMDKCNYDNILDAIPRLQQRRFDIERYNAKDGTPLMIYIKMNMLYKIMKALSFDMLFLGCFETNSVICVNSDVRYEDELNLAIDQWISNRGLYSLWGVIDLSLFPSQILDRIISRYPYLIVDNPEGDEIQPAYLDVKSIASVEKYLNGHKRMRRNIGLAYRKGVTTEMIEGHLTHELAMELTELQVTIIFKKRLSHQIKITETQVNMLRETFHDALRHGADFIHFISRINGRINGFHTFCAFRNHNDHGINEIMGAYDATLQTNLHTYECNIVKILEYGLKHKFGKIYFGPMNNQTKVRFLKIDKDRKIKTMVFSQYRIFKYIFGLYRTFHIYSSRDSQ